MPSIPPLSALTLAIEHVLNSLAPNSVLLASYDLLRKISQQSLTTEELSTLNLPDCTDLRSFLFEVIVADEAHCLRNPHTETSQAIFALKVSLFP
jgi:SNF2 family DNA or RNA helicase